MVVLSFRRLFATLAFAIVASVGTSTVFASNVDALLEGEQLKLIGDNFANAVTVTQNARGDVVVSGRNGTTVNGRPSARFPFAVLNTVEVLLEGGNDDLVVNGLTVNNDLYVNLGAGNDSLRSGRTPAFIINNLAVEGGAGDDRVTLAGWGVGSDVTIDGQVGGLTATLSELTVGFSISCVGDMARDVIRITDCSTADFLSVETKGGNDLVEITSVSALGVVAATDDGLDIIRMIDVTTLDDVAITTGKDNDVVEMIGVSTAKNISVSLDEGRDSFTGIDVTAQFDAIFEGGAGVDTYVDGGIFANKIEVKEFEILQ